MQNIYDIHDFDDAFIEQFKHQILPIYDLWSIRPLENDKKELINGRSKDVEQFTNFIKEHSEKDYPHPLLIVVGNCQNGNPEEMLNSTKRYYKLKFDKYKSNDVGSSLGLGGFSSQFQQSGFPPMQFSGLYNQSGNNMSGINWNDLQGVIDRNVSDATRSIKAEFDQENAKREAETMRRLAEMETRLIEYKLDMKAQELENREREIDDRIRQHEEKQSDNMGKVREYAKALAGGLLELGADWMGVEKKNKDKKNKQEDNSNTKNNASSGFRDTAIDGFQESTSNNQDSRSNQTGNESEMGGLLEAIGQLNDEEKLQLLDLLIPDDIKQEIDEENNKTSQETQQQKKESSENTKEETESETEEINNQTDEEE